MRILLSVFVAGLLSTGCMTYDKLIAKNQRNITKLQIGMGEVELHRVMRHGTHKIHSSASPFPEILFPPALLALMAGIDELPNPLRRAKYRAADDAELEVLFYYTERNSADGIVADDELTPVALRDGEVIGWGWSYVRENLTLIETRTEDR